MTLYTFVHVVICLAGIVSGLFVLFGMIGNNRMDAIPSIFLLFTVLTSVTGFLFPITKLTPALILGIMSVGVLAVAIAARYVFAMQRAWRWIYVVAVIVVQYFNSFVLVVQSFLKIPALHALAPQGSEPPFVVVQGLILLFYIVTGYLAVRRFKP